ncbi:MAG TPA: 50S ribosomal protein L21 [Candidatus Riflebacteria bacterium]|jgi:large subunit ribosomal protein L21|nr:MAG: 50S ribosomal protein L21 [Candidatus Riflebacteria bacterium HGW-Riflebacteria-1]HAE39740.1 50S ribosomal protein L21 [Candidatus Riflebacteria bacterium]
MYAIIEIGGRQYNVEKGSRLRCEKLDQEANEIMSIDKVLMVKDGEKLQIGHPYVKGAEVKARIVGHARGKKIIVLKYKSKSNYRRKIGHRQHFTSVLIEEIKC